MNLPNSITLLRILLTPAFISCILYYKAGNDYLRFMALGIFTAAVLTDAADGLLARMLKQKTTIGTILDPIADKLLLITAFISLANWPAEVRLPLWVPVIVVSRDIFIALGIAVIFIISGVVNISPSPLGKITTFFQMATIISVLLLSEHSVYIWNITVVFTALSGINYLVRGARFLNANHGKK